MCRVATTQRRIIHQLESHLIEGVTSGSSANCDGRYKLGGEKEERRYVEKAAVDRLRVHLFRVYIRPNSGLFRDSNVIFFQGVFSYHCRRIHLVSFKHCNH
jgi:hypothetical protein